MTQEDSGDRLAQIEARLARLEEALAAMGEVRSSVQTHGGVEAQASPLPALDASPPATRPTRSRRATRSTPSASTLGATQLLGWSGAMALVLAALYLIRLGLDSGWLTPLRQLLLALLGAGSLIGAGLLLRRHDRQYAAFLPAAGVVVLFASVYAAHLFYGLIGERTALLGIVGVVVLALGLGRLFDSVLYALFAVAGSYLAPLFLPDLRGGIGDLAIYFSAWSLLFGLYALRVRQRAVYLLAMYLALGVFALLFERHLMDEWVGALVFQSVQFVIFLTVAAVFSLRAGQGMSAGELFWHFPALLLFHLLQYDLLERHLPMGAPWVELAAAALVLAVFWGVRARLGAVSTAAATGVSAYLALVLLHALYFELLPDEARPWGGLLLLAALPWGLRAAGAGSSIRWVGPLLLAGALVLLLNFPRLWLNENMAPVWGGTALLCLYPALAYVAYVALRREPGLEAARMLLLGVGHISAMTSAAHLIDTSALVSVAWLALAGLALAGGFLWRDRPLGQSSLLLFLLAGLKIVLFDLAHTAPLLRVLVLLALGVSLYLGGWVYRKLPEAGA
ncbi:MAG: DUF2339 domain-containing protein [Halothiobacillaceae bacterium]|nr:DUF2339 domain-containing protein [Halothiobacillaceae bacterium]